MNLKIYLKNIYRLFIASILIIMLFSLCSCDGEDGEDGRNGVDGKDGNDGASPLVIIPDDNDDIQNAIDSLPVYGGSVFIRAGLYTLSNGLHIKRSNISIYGEQGTVLKLADSVNEPVILIGTDSEIPAMRIENIDITNLELDGNKDMQQSESDPKRSWIRNNTIDIRMTDNLWIKNINAYNARSGGLVVSWDSHRIFVNNSYFHHNFFDGIALYDSEDIYISNFMADNNNAAGLSLDNKLSNVIFSNGSIKNNGDVGIFARDSEDLCFDNLFIANNLSHGCFLSHQSTGTDTGVKRLFFSSSSFIGNDGFGIWLASTVADSPSNAVTGSIFADNTSGAIQVDAGGNLDQSGNIMQ